MYAAVDVHYLPSGEARAALVVAPSAAFSVIETEKVVLVPEVAPYVPGQFWRRELPCLQAGLTGVSGLSLLGVDGYVDLGPSGRPGAAAHAPAAFAAPVGSRAPTRF